MNYKGCYVWYDFYTFIIQNLPLEDRNKDHILHIGLYDACTINRLFFF